MNAKEISLTTDPIPKLILRIALPTSMGMLFNTLFNFVDTYCAGLLSTDALAALSLSFPSYFMLIAAGSGLSQGATALIANALGAGDEVRARLVFAQSLLFATGVGLLISVIGLLTAPGIFHLLGATGAYHATSLAYLNVIFLGGVFFVLSMAVNGALSAQGETRAYRNFLIIGFFANCALNPLLMWGFLAVPSMGVAGIALATVLVQIFGCWFLWRRARRTSFLKSLPPALFWPDRAILKEVAGQAVPAALNMATIALGVFVITWFVQHFGKEAVAATGIATRIEQIFLMPAIGISTAMLSITGQNHGAGLPHRVRDAWKINVALGVGSMVLGGGLLLCMADGAMRLFTSDAAVIAHGLDYLKVSALTLAAYPILFATVFLMQGLKRPGYGLWMGIYRQVAAPVIVFHWLVFAWNWGLRGVWWGFCFVTWSAAIIALFYGARTVSPSQRTKSKPDPMKIITPIAMIIATSCADCSFTSTYRESDAAKVLRSQSASNALVFLT